MKRLLILSLCLAACQDDATETPDDVSSAEDGLSAVEATEDAVLVSGYVEGAGTVPEAEIAVKAQVTVPACVTITSDHTTYLEARFTSCTGRYDAVALNGTLRAELKAEAGAIVYELSTSDLTVGQTQIEGSWEVRDPLAPAAATTLSGSLSISRGARSVTFATEASWTLTGECVTYSVDAQVTDGERSLSVAADAVTRCAGACPASGTVTVTGAQSSTLSWTFDASSEVTLTGSLGGEHSLTLACGG